jgi:hypothetical protein
MPVANRFRFILSVLDLSGGKIWPFLYCFFKRLLVWSRVLWFLLKELVLVDDRVLHLIGKANSIVSARPCYSGRNWVCILLVGPSPNLLPSMT